IQAREPDRAWAQRGLALVLMTRPNGLPEAIGLLEELLARRVGAASDQFLLAQLYEANGDWPKAQERAQRLLAWNDREPAYLAWYVRGLLRAGKAVEVQPWLQKLKELQPHSFPTVALRARLLLAQGRGSEAVALIGEYAQAGDAELEPAPALLEGLGRAGG